MLEVVSLEVLGEVTRRSGRLAGSNDSRGDVGRNREATGTEKRIPDFWECDNEAEYTTNKRNGE